MLLPVFKRHQRSVRPSLSLASMAILVLSALYFLMPLYWLAISSTKGLGDLFTTFGFWFGHNWQLGQNIHDLWTFQDGIFRHWLFNSFLYASVCASVASFVAALAGYAMAKYTFRGRDFGFSVILGAILVPITALAIPLYLMMSKLNLANSSFAVMLPFFVSPIGVYLARIYTASAVPDALLDAARVDGAGEFRIFVTIALPLLTPAFVTVFLLQFIAVWNSYFIPLVMLSDPTKYPLSLGLQTWNVGQAAYAKNIDNLLITGSFLSILPLIVLFLMLQRSWRSGLAAGSITS